MASKVKYRVPSLAYWPALLWPGAQPEQERDRVQPWARLHEAIAPRNDDDNYSNNNNNNGERPPVVAEFGIGRGDWLRSRAVAQPETVFLGVEASLHFIRYADRFTREAGLENLFLAFGDARLTVLPAYIPAGTLSEAHFLFPDPWTRKRHKWRRMLARRQLPYIIRALRPGALLRLRTDVPDYVDEARANLNEVGMQCVADETNNDPEKAVTRWEVRKLAEGASIGELRYVKPATLDEQLRRTGQWPGFEDVPLDLRGVAKHEPSILQNAGYEPLPESVADAERPVAAQQTGYGPLALRERTVLPGTDPANAEPTPPPAGDVRSRTRLYLRTLAPHDVTGEGKTEKHHD